MPYGDCTVIVFAELSFYLLYDGCPQCALLSAAVVVFGQLFTIADAVVYCLHRLLYSVHDFSCCGGFKGKIKARPQYH